MDKIIEDIELAKLAKYNQSGNCKFLTLRFNG